jgi:tetratricopeptide (TPR) repeat protein
VADAGAAGGNGPASAAAAERAALRAKATFVGSAACADCHRPEHAAWKGSQHERAMQHATDGTVLGDFSGATYTRDGVTSTFFKRDGKFFIRTDGPDGQLADFEVKYTFGVEPQQQYLVDLPGGRLQAVSVTWDTRPKEQGGQRWFRQYPGEKLDHRDELHWTQRAQNWNFMCADCHSTDVRKGYDDAKGGYDTRYAEVSVGCESCHGPGSAHVAARGAGGLTVALHERRDIAWVIDPATGNARRSAPRTTDDEMETCARCHSRRSQFAEGWRAGDRLLDHFLPVTLREGLYHPDGQQQDEVFIWGSFRQSKMHEAGVTCADCHDPHTQKMRLPGDATCAQCHAPARYAVVEHHRHEPGKSGSQCVDCHMPATTYMVNDPRRDHGFKVPRPDLTASTGAPNACGSCHEREGAEWAATALDRWHGTAWRARPSIAPALHAARRGLPGAARGLQGLVDDPKQPAMVRASALELLARYPSPLADGALQRALGDRDDLTRHVAVTRLEALPAEARPALLVPRLTDRVRAVRMEAARLLLPSAALLDASARPAFDAAIAEYEAALRHDLSRPEARLNLGNLLLQRGDAAGAESSFKRAIAADPRFVPARVNLADLYRGQGREDEADRVLRDGLRAAPGAAALHEGLGLSLVRQGRKPAAIAEFAAAARAAPAEARYAYLHALALHDAGRRDEAMRVLADAARRAPDRDLLLTLAQWRSEGGDETGAREALSAWYAVSPDDPALAALQPR